MSDNLNWYPGQRVVCIDDNQRIPGDPINLEEGRIYTIRSAAPFHFADRDDLGIRLNDVSRNHPWYVDAPFGACRFRPLEPKALELFRKIAASPKQKVRA